jgi:hypothetical protein
MTKRELDNAATSSLGQALEAEARAKSLNAQSRRSDGGVDGICRAPSA